jgi:hypothetical protein
MGRRYASRKAEVDPVEDKPISREEYVRRVLDAYRTTPGTTGNVRRADRLLAVQLYQRGVPLIAFENALVLAVTRRLVRPADALPLGTIRSLAYFVPVIEEVLEIKVGQDYFEYLRFRLSRSSPNLKKTPASR